MEGQHWVADLMHTYKHDGYDAAWDSLVAFRKPLRNQVKREAVARLMQYGAERSDMIRYSEFLSQDWQIGSGPAKRQPRDVVEIVKKLAPARALY